MIKTVYRPALPIIGGGISLFRLGSAMLAIGSKIPPEASQIHVKTALHCVKYNFQKPGPENLCGPPFWKPLPPAKKHELDACNVPQMVTDTQIQGALINMF